MNKQIFVSLLVCAVVASVFSACTDREDKDGLLEDIKCGLSKTKDTVQESFSSAISSDTVQNSYSYVKNKTAGATDVISDAAKKTGSFLSEGFSTLWDKTKSGYAAAKDAIQGKKPAPESDSGFMEAVKLDVPTVAS